MATAAPTRPRRVLERFPAGGPRGSWPAEKFAEARRMEGQPAEVVMDLASDAFLVIVPAEAARWRCPHCDTFNTEKRDPKRCHCCGKPRQAVAS